MRGMKRPVILDVKIGDRAVGSFDGEPAFETVLEIYSKTNSKQREEALQMYHQCKKRNTHKNLTFQDLKLSLSSSTSSEDIHFVMKHLAQRKRIEQTASSQLGFRIAGSNLTSKSELKTLNAESTIKYISDTFLCAGSTSEKIQRARNLLRAIVPVSDYLRCNCRHRFYSSSLILVYDAQVKDVARVHWVDFCHVYADRDVSWSGGSDKACLRAVSSSVTQITLNVTRIAQGNHSNRNSNTTLETGTELERYLTSHCCRHTIHNTSISCSEFCGISTAHPRSFFESCVRLQRNEQSPTKRFASTHESVKFLIIIQ